MQAASLQPYHSFGSRPRAGLQLLLALDHPVPQSDRWNKQQLLINLELQSRVQAASLQPYHGFSSRPGTRLQLLPWQRNHHAPAGTVTADKLNLLRLLGMCQHQHGSSVGEISAARVKESSLLWLLASCQVMCTCTWWPANLISSLARAFTAPQAIWNLPMVSASSKAAVQPDAFSAQP